MAPAQTEPDLSFLLDHTSHVLRTRMAAALDEIGLTARMHCVLVHALGEERTQIQLAEIGGMDKTTMVVTVDALEKAGLAERRPSGTDRRARVIAVTERGAALAEKSSAIVDRVHADALASLTDTDRQALLRGLNLLVEGDLKAPRRARARLAAPASKQSGVPRMAQSQGRAAPSGREWGKALCPGGQTTPEAYTWDSSTS